MGQRTYLVEHQHTDETCPSQTEEGIRMMAEVVLGSDHAARAGVKVVQHNVVVGKHRLLLVVEAADQASAERFAEPFKMVGTASVHEIRTCEAVMAEALEELRAARAEA